MNYGPMKTNDVVLFILVALFLCTAFLAYGTPQLIQNEGVYLLKSRQLVDPMFLSADWAFGEETTRTHGMLFTILVAPAWLINISPVGVALLVRTIETFVFLGCAMIFLRRAGLSIAPGLIGLSVWVIAGQLSLAGEWVLGGAEQKPFAYAAILLAFSYAFQSRWIGMAICLSIATWFHVLVGGWAAILLFGSLLLLREDRVSSSVIKSGILAAVLVLPVLAMSIYEMTSAVSGVEWPIPPFDSISQLLVYFRVPHHLDPSYFLNFSKLAKFVLVASALFLSIFVIQFDVRVRHTIALTSGIAILLALAGAMAFVLGITQFLGLYPFRISDGLIPLFAYMLLPYGLITAFRTIDLQKMRTSMLPGAVMAISLLLSYVAIDEVRERSEATINSWLRSPTSTDRADREMVYDWVRNNTATTSSFVTPPYWGDFRLLAERPVFVSMKSIPNNELIWDWYTRILLANNDNSFHEVGFDAYVELRANYQQLSQPLLNEISSKYGVTYYVTEQARHDLAKNLRFKSGSIHVYDIRQVQLAKTGINTNNDFDLFGE